MKTLVFLLLVLPPSWSTQRLGQKDSDLDAELELEDGGVHSHEDPYTSAARVKTSDDVDKGYIPLCYTEPTDSKYTLECANGEFAQRWNGCIELGSQRVRCPKYHYPCNNIRPNGKEFYCSVTSCKGDTFGGKRNDCIEDGQEGTESEDNAGKRLKRASPQESMASSSERSFHGFATSSFDGDEEGDDDANHQVDHEHQQGEAVPTRPTPTPTPEDSPPKDEQTPQTTRLVTFPGSEQSSEKASRFGGRSRRSELSCPSININTQRRRDAEALKNIGSAEECSKKCRQKRTCNFWTWHHKDAGIWAFGCVLMSGYGNIAYDNNVLSGAKTCNLRGCWMYQHCNYKGKRLEVPRNGREPSLRPWSFNDKASSFRLSSDCKLYVWQHEYYRGSSVRVTGHLHCAEKSWNDVISSVKCIC